MSALLSRAEESGAGGGRAAQDEEADGEGRSDPTFPYGPARGASAPGFSPLGLLFDLFAFDSGEGVR